MLSEAGLAGASAPAGFVRAGLIELAVVAVGLAAAVARADPGEAELAAKARIRPAQSSSAAIAGDDLVRLRGALGDSFSPSEAFPGTVLVFSGVPYVMVRGAPPAGTTTYLDGVPVPSLFHLALGPAITHPELIGELRFHPGVAPARYGRHTGAVLSAEPAREHPQGRRGEAELRLLDAQGLALFAGPPELALHARVGYPAGMLELVGSSAELSYWDYDARWRYALGDVDRLEVAAFGAGDHVGDRREPDDDIGLQFHRGLVRFTRSLSDLDFVASLYVGHDRGRVGTELTAVSDRIGPSFSLAIDAAPGVRVRLGADMEAKLVTLRRAADPNVPMAPEVDRLTGQPVMDLPGVPQLQPNVTEFIDRAPLAGVPARNVVGAYAELDVALPADLEVEAGLRSDVWLAAGEAQQAIDQRLLLRWNVTDRLALHAGVGSAHQAAASPLPIPGLDDFELDRGLQSALQSEVGATLELPGEFQLSATGFLHDYSDLVFLELVVDCEGHTDPLARLNPAQRTGEAVEVCEGQGLPRGSGQAHGLEFLLRRSLRERLTGWINYTLAWASANAADGTEFVPQFDVRHLVNLVLAYRWSAGLESGARLHFRSGKPAVNTIFDFVSGRLERLHTRLPAFFRLDLNLGYQWSTAWGRLWITLQWLNVTFARESTKRDCRFDAELRLRCDVDSQPAIVLPNAGIRAEF